MTNLSPRGCLAAAEFAIFIPSFVLSIWICHRHGFRQCRKSGWFYLVMLALLRLVGASATLYAALHQSTVSIGVLITAAITSAIGTAPLLLVLLGFLERINPRLTSHSLPQLVFRPIHILSLVGLILAIVGIVDETDSSPGSSSDISTGRALFQAATILFLAIWLGLASITVHSFIRIAHAPATERYLIHAGIVVLPFLLVRVIYTVCVGFSTDHPGSVFDEAHPDVWVEAFMQFAMEAVCMIVYIWAGLVTPRQKMVDAERERDQRDDAKELRVMESGRVSATGEAS